MSQYPVIVVLVAFAPTIPAASVDLGGRTPVRLATLHANSEADARLLLSMAEEKISTTESIFAEVSPVIGTHAGPGTVGLAYMAGM